MQRLFFWKNSTTTITHETLYNDYKAGRLKNVNIPNKIIALSCFWIRRLYDRSFDEWKLILLYLIENSFDTLFKFLSDLPLKTYKTKLFFLIFL